MKKIVMFFLQKIIEKCLVKNSKKRANVFEIKEFVLNEEKNIIKN